MPYARNNWQVISWQAPAGSLALAARTSVSNPAAQERDLTIPLEQYICFLAVVMIPGSPPGTKMIEPQIAQIYTDFKGNQWNPWFIFGADTEIRRVVKKTSVLPKDTGTV
jgi:hypothetical protein